MKRASHFLYSSITIVHCIKYAPNLLLLIPKRVVTKIKIRLFERAYLNRFRINKTD